MPEKNIARLQRVENNLTRVVTKAPRFICSVPILKQLHWLPVKCRIQFKICTLIFRTIRYNKLAYTGDLLARPKCSKYLLSTNSNRFVVPRTKNGLGQELSPYLAHPYGAPCLCPYNAETILTFRKLPKPHLVDLGPLLI